MNVAVPSCFTRRRTPAMHAMFVSFGLLLALSFRSVFAQQPITITMEYQVAEGQLSTDQLALLKSTMNAAYKALQKYVLVPSPPGHLLSERVCRNYTLAPPPPQTPLQPPPPSSPNPPALPPPFATRRRLLQASPPPTPPSPPPSTATPTAATVLRCYPDWAEGADPRVAQCGWAAVSGRHVRDWAGPAAGSGTAVSLEGTPGELTDLYLYVTAAAEDTACAPARDIRAATCLYDTATGRPTLAALNVCPQAMERYSPNALVTRALREIIRALGVERVGFFGLAPMAAVRSHLRERTDEAGRTLRFLATPGVTEAVRSHFGCPTAPGALLEDATSASASSLDSDGSLLLLGPGEELADGEYLERAGIAFAGWETTHFQGDILVADPDPTPASGLAPQVTPLTLALLADTAWYTVNGSSAGHWGWGRGAGCDLASRHCSQLMGGSSGTAGVGGQQLFCDPAASPTQQCAPGSRSLGPCRSDPVYTSPACGLVTSATPELPTCAFPEALHAALPPPASSASASFSLTAPTTSELFGWAAGPSARCVPVGWPWVARTPVASVSASAITSTTLTLSYPSEAALTAPAAGAACFRSSCNTAGELFVEVGGRQLACPSGAVLNLTEALGLANSTANANSTAARGGSGSMGLQAGLLGPCPDNAAVCGSLRGCDPATCSTTGGECIAAEDGEEGVGGSTAAAQCYCKAMYGGAACEVDLLTGAVEDVGEVAAAGAVVEVGVVLGGPLSAFLARRQQFLAVMGAAAKQVLGSSPAPSLALSRLQPMVAFPDYTAAGGEPGDLQVVLRLLAPSAATAALWEGRLAAAGGLPAGALQAYGLEPRSNITTFLGRVLLRSPSPPPPVSPSPPPTPPSPPRPPQTPPPPDPASLRSRAGLTGDEKVALGVGITFGVLALLLLAATLVAFLAWRRSHPAPQRTTSPSTLRRTLPAVSTAAPAAAGGMPDSGRLAGHSDGVAHVTTPIAAAAAAAAAAGNYDGDAAPAPTPVAGIR